MLDDLRQTLSKHVGVVPVSSDSRFHLGIRLFRGLRGFDGRTMAGCALFRRGLVEQDRLAV